MCERERPGQPLLLWKPRAPWHLMVCGTPENEVECFPVQVHTETVEGHRAKCVTMRVSGVCRQSARLEWRWGNLWVARAEGFWECAGVALRANLPLACQSVRLVLSPHYAPLQNALAPPCAQPLSTAWKPWLCAVASWSYWDDHSHPGDTSVWWHTKSRGPEPEACGLITWKACSRQFAFVA